MNHATRSSLHLMVGELYTLLPLGKKNKTKQNKNIVGYRNVGVQPWACFWKNSKISSYMYS